METTSDTGKNPSGASSEEAMAALEVVQNSPRRHFEARQEPWWLWIAATICFAVLTASLTTDFRGSHTLRLASFIVLAGLSIWWERRVGVKRFRRRSVPRSRVSTGLTVGFGVASLGIVFLPKLLEPGWQYLWLVQTGAATAFFVAWVILYRRYERRDFERWLATQTT